MASRQYDYKGQTITYDIVFNDGVYDVLITEYSELTDVQIALFKERILNESELYQRSASGSQLRASRRFTKSG